jgi:hypothetical protein
MQQGILASWTDTILSAISNSVNAFLIFIPNLIGALIIFSIGWIFAGFAKRIVLKFLEIAQLEPFAEKVGMSNALKRAGVAVTPSELLAEIVRWAVVLVFLNPTVEIMGLSKVTEVINTVLLYIPNVIVAALILMFGIIFADLTAQFIKGTAAALGTGTANALEAITKYAMVTFVVLAALSQLGIAERLITTLFTGLVAMVAIAGGLAFGLGGKEMAADILNGLKRSLQEREA